MILVLAYAGFGSRAVDSSDYRQIVDLTFPLEAGARYSDDYDVPRAEPARAHRATDLFAPAGAPVYAAVGGTISWMPGQHANAGYAMHIAGTDGRLYAYYHLGPHGGPPDRAYAPGLQEGSRVARGQLIGYLGDSGNAAGGAPHLHFEIQADGVADPYGSDHINPQPSLAAAEERGDYPHRHVQAASGGGVLRSGDSGPAVSDWQGRLNRAGVGPIAVDGAFGPQTEHATRQFQTSQGIAVDGVVGPQTRQAMERALAARAGSGASLLRLGDRGPAVGDWQTQLNQVGIGPIAVDGVFGPQTEQATRQFQQARGIAVDGVVGPETRQAMRAALA